MKPIELTREGKLHWVDYTKNACVKHDNNSISDVMPAFFPINGKRDLFGVLGASGITPTGEVMAAANAASAVEKIIAKTKVKYPGTSTLPFLVWMSLCGRDTQAKAPTYVVLNKAMIEAYMPTIINRLALDENKADYLETVARIEATSSAQEDEGQAAFERDTKFPWARGLQIDSVWRNRAIGLITDLLQDCAITVKSDESDEGRAIENTFLFLMYLAATTGLSPQYVIYVLTNLGLHRYIPNLVSNRIRTSMERDKVLIDGKMNPVIYHYVSNVVEDNNKIISQLRSLGSTDAYSQALYHLKVTDQTIDGRFEAVSEGQSILSVFGFGGTITEKVPATIAHLEEFYVKDSLNQSVAKMESYLSLDKLNKTAKVKKILAPFNEAQMSSALRVKYTRGIKEILTDILDCAESFNSAQSQIKSLIEALSISSMIEMTQKLADIDKNVDVMIESLDLLVKEALLANEEANDVALRQEVVVPKSESELLKMYEDEIHTLTGKVQDLTTQLADAQQKLQKAGQLIAEQPTQENIPSVKCDHNMLQRALSDDLRLDEIPGIVQSYFSHVVFLPGSTDLLKNSIYRKPAKVLEALIRLCGPYYETLMSGKPDSVAMDILGTMYRANESEGTMSCADLRRQRMFKVNGEQVAFEQHLDVGVRHGDAYCMQIHFRIIDRIVYIGRMGGHLPVSKVR